MKTKALEEYDLHPRGAHVDDALSYLERIIGSARARGPKLFGVITGYGSSGGTSRIKASVLAACAKYKRQNHIRGYLDGEMAGDMFSAEFLAFPMAYELPVEYKRSPNPGIVFICV